MQFLRHKTKLLDYLADSIGEKPRVRLEHLPAHILAPAGVEGTGDCLVSGGLCHECSPALCCECSLFAALCTRM